MKTIDLRSDTVTHPTEEMRRAMFEAEVGDDVYGEDPTVNSLEKMAAHRMQKDAAVFTASGTMSNLLSVLAQTHRGDEIIVGSEAHIFWYEVAGASAIGGVMVRTVHNEPDGRINLESIETAIRAKNLHFPATTLLCLENTHNRCGGAVLTAEYTEVAGRLAHANGMRLHVDGARLFNASVALGVPASSLVSEADSVSFCLSKGLSAPIGSLLCGDRAFVERARKWRKMIGGGTRQVGVIAAAGIVALNTMIDRLSEDHENARSLAAGLAQIGGCVVTANVATNIVMFELTPEIDIAVFLREMETRKVKVSPRGGGQFRAVTHRMVSEGDIGEALDRIEAAVKASAR